MVDAGDSLVSVSEHFFKRVLQVVCKPCAQLKRNVGRWSLVGVDAKRLHSARQCL
jgi:hypothetical protein